MCCLQHGHVQQEWKPRWGYKRIKDPKDDWLIEVPDNAGNAVFDLLRVLFLTLFTFESRSL